MKRIAVYARVSTDHEDQKNSIENQKQYFEQRIRENKDWKLYKIYADEGISGTSLRHREQFKQMYEDAKKGLFDIILTKEVCRFARNTVDALEKTRELKSMGIEVRFLIDNISTFDTDGELRLTIMAGLAQDESRRISERVQFGVIQQMKKGVAFGNSMYGYDFKNGQLVINEKEAEIVREIYHLYLDDGYGAHKIAKKLREDCVPIKRPLFAKNSYAWQSETILEILSNEKYVGDLKQRKTYTVDFLSHKKKINQGEVEFIEQKNHHVPIIDRQTFEAVQKERERRKNIYKVDKECFANRHALSGKIKCGECGKAYVSSVGKIRADGTRRQFWTCSTKRKYGLKHILPNGTECGCNSVRVSDTAMKKIFRMALLKANVDKGTLEQSLIRTLTEMMNKYSKKNTTDLETQRKDLENEKKRLLDLYLQDIISLDSYKLKNEDIDKKIEEVNRKLQSQSKNKDDENSLNKAIKKTKEIIKNNEYDDNIIKQLLEKIVIIDNEKVEVYLKNYDNPFCFNNLSDIEGRKNGKVQKEEI